MGYLHPSWNLALPMKAAVMNEKDRALDFGKIDCLSIHPP
jgi:hypothetical protein